MERPLPALARALREAGAAVGELLDAAFAGLAEARGLPAPTTPPALGDLRVAARAAEPEALGQVYEALLATDQRRASGSHYTPRALAAEVVEHTLAPLDSPRAVCDLAMGGGVFLIEACRRLAAHTPGGARAAAESLYGVDRDPRAVEVARRALWLFVADADWPLDALAERLRCGDALVGAVDAAGGELGRLASRIWGDGAVEPFDWPEAFPEVFARGGFDAVVGNPPFLGGSFISGALGRGYRDHLVREVAGGRRGNADLCAYFFLRAHRLLRPGGRAGLVATNTIAEGDTRRVGLEPMLADGAVLERAERARPWPGDASLHCSLVWWRKGGDGPRPVLDGRPVTAIDASLTPAGAAPLQPGRLAANRGLAFNGTKIYGQGFLLTPDEARRLLDADPRRAEVLRPYLGGDDVYGRPDGAPSRWAICFHEWPLADAERFPELLARVRERVKPERDRLAGRNAIGDRRAARWWQFGSYAPALYAAVAGRERVIVKVLHSHTHAFAYAPGDCVFSHALAVFADDDPALLAVLQSAIHEAWALAHGSSLGDAPRYTLSKTFETFPLPPLDEALAAAGREFDDHRRATALNRGEGLTKLWQRMHDPCETAADIIELRTRQRAVDQAVAGAYGWPDDLGHDFRPTPAGVRFGPAPEARDRVMARLAELNAAG